MGEEAFDEVIIPLADGSQLILTGGYGRDEVCLGIRSRASKGLEGWPDLLVRLDREERTALRKALRSLMGGGL